MNPLKSKRAIERRLQKRNNLNKLLICLLSIICLSSNAIHSFASESESVSTTVGNAVTDKRITGTVLDAYGDPVIGANVILKGTSVGIITDLDGKFELNVPDNAAILQFSYIGYMTQEVTIGNQQTFNIILKEDGNTNERDPLRPL